ncbi:MAG: single-stranded-DNA-specific exonuclease RecJ [Desulfuromonadales bacterium]
MEPVSERRWLLRTAPPEAALLDRLSETLEVPPLVARLLAHRGLESDTAGGFLQNRLADLPDPFLLPDMEFAVRRLQRAIEQGERIAVHGDYDVDGITGTALLCSLLTALDGQVDYHIPLRLRDGYGLSATALRRAAQEGVALVISVDCGVSAVEEAALARELGLELIITDHHQPPEVLPTALAVINPQRPDSLFPCADLAGVGVAFFLLIALRQRLRESGWFNQRPEPDLREALDLVALGTIADLVPLRGVNRILVSHGLRALQRGVRIGIRALKQVAGIDRVTCGAVGFQLAPRLNAAGRLEDAERGVDLLLQDDMLTALTTARSLDQCNRQRQELEKRILQEAEKAVAALPAQRSHVIVLAQDAWHPGVIGIVASRLVERYHRPTVLIALEGSIGKGSARSIGGFHLYRGLQHCAGLLTAFGGHAMAAGLTLERERLEDFAAALEIHARDAIDPQDLVPSLRHDGVVLLEELDLSVLQLCERLEPFGIGNPEPLLVVASVRARQIQELSGGHLRFNACQGGFSHPAIAFGMQARRAEFAGEIDLLVAPQINHYKGRKTVQLRVRDVRPASADEVLVG